MSEPHKAYEVIVVGKVYKTLIVYADSVEDATALIRYGDRDGPNVIVCDNDFEETGVQRARRQPFEDRPRG